MPAVPSPLTVDTGLSSSSDFNTKVRDPLRFLMSPPLARLRQIVAQSLTNGATTAITFTTADVDTDYVGGTGHSNSVNPTRYTANWTGWYVVSGGINFVANATGARGCYWAVNGSIALGVESVGAPAPGGANHGHTARTELLFLNEADYVELLGLQISGGTLNTVATATTMNVRRVSN